MTTIERHRFDVACQRCGYAWQTKPCASDELPARCPKCKSIYWRRPRKPPSATVTAGTVTLDRVPEKLIAEIDAWAALRHHTFDAAAIELLRIGLEAVSARQALIDTHHADPTASPTT